MTEILKATTTGLEQVAQALRAGELVALPTETVYGLAGNALDSSVVAMIFEAKERPHFDPLIVHIPAPARSWTVDALAEQEWIAPERLTLPQKERLDQLMAAFWPGPLTLIFPKSKAIPNLVTAGLDTVAIRCPNHPLFQEVLKRTGFPLAAPSANRFGRISPTQARHVLNELEDRIPWILDGGAAEHGLESTVIEVLSNGTLVCHRPGSLPLEKVTDLGMEVTTPNDPRNQSPALQAPGTMESHYAPFQPFHLLTPVTQGGSINEEHWKSIRDHLAEDSDNSTPLGFLIFQGERAILQAQLEKELSRPIILEILSPQGLLTEAAKNFFDYLRALQDSGAAHLFAIPPDERGSLSLALWDRLRRATAETRRKSRGKP